MLLKQAFKWNFCHLLKLRYSEKATKLKKISDFFDGTWYVLRQKLGDFFKIVWPSQNTWSLQDVINKFSNNSHKSDYENTWCLPHYSLIFINTEESANNNKVCFVRKSSRGREEHIRNSYDKWAINCCLLFDSGWSRCPTVRGRFRTTIVAVMEFQNQRAIKNFFVSTKTLHFCE